MGRAPARTSRTKISKEERDFLLKTELLLAAQEKAGTRLLPSMTRKMGQSRRTLHFPWGGSGGCFYVIQKGSCTVAMKKSGAIHPAVRIREGDLVGEMAVLTGETRKHLVTRRRTWCRGKSTGQSLTDSAIPILNTRVVILCSGLPQNP